MLAHGHGKKKKTDLVKEKEKYIEDYPYIVVHQAEKDRREKVEVCWTGVLLGNRRYVRSDDTEIAVTQPTLIGRLVIGWILGSGAYYFFFCKETGSIEGDVRRILSLSRMYRWSKACE